MSAALASQASAFATAAPDEPVSAAGLPQAATDRPQIRSVPLDQGLATGLVWQAGRLAAAPGAVLPTGFGQLDAQLPGGGWPLGTLTEILFDQPGIGELSLLMPALRGLGGDRWQAWIAPPFVPYAPALEAAGLSLARILLVTPETSGEVLWATRQAVSSAACGAVLSWPQRIDSAGLRRLQLAAEESAHTLLFLFRPRAEARQASPAGLRLGLTACSDGLRVDILKRRGPPAASPLWLPVRQFEAGLRPGDDVRAPSGIHDDVARPRPQRSAAAGL